MLLHHMTLVSFRLLRKNLGNLSKVLSKWSTAPPPLPWQNIFRTPMLQPEPDLTPLQEAPSFLSDLFANDFTEADDLRFQVNRL